MPENNEKEIKITNLYPDLTPEQQAEAAENWLQYLRVVKRIFEYVAEEHAEILTELEKRVRLRKENIRR